MTDRDNTCSHVMIDTATESIIHFHHFQKSLTIPKHVKHPQTSLTVKDLLKQSWTCAQIPIRHPQTSRHRRTCLAPQDTPSCLDFNCRSDMARGDRYRLLSDLTASGRLPVRRRTSAAHPGPRPRPGQHRNEVL